MIKIPKVYLSLELNRAYGRSLIRGITQYSKLYGPWNLYMGTPYYYRRSKREESSLAEVIKWHPDGIIMREDPEIDKVKDLGIPIIFSTYTTTQISGFVSLVGDHENPGRLAAEHFLERGFKHFAYCGISNSYWSACRGERFCKWIVKAGYDVNSFPSTRLKSKVALKADNEELMRWLHDLPKPVAIMTCTDERSMNVVEACRAVRLHVPEEVALVGVDNDELLCEAVNPSLSSIAIDGCKAGYQAAETLDKLMKGRSCNIDKPIIAQATHVVVRQSSNIFAVEDSTTRTALQYISANARQAIQVKDVAHACGLSVRALQKKFKFCLNKSISDEIDRIRIDLICRLLAETDRKISQIFLDFDFVTQGHFSRYFRRLKNMSPKMYRKKYGESKKNTPY